MIVYELDYVAHFNVRFPSEKVGDHCSMAFRADIFRAVRAMVEQKFEKVAQPIEIVCDVT
jgi:hypothetical protein